MSKVTSRIRCMLAFSPRGWYTNNVKMPVLMFVHETIEFYKQRTRSGVNGIRDVLFRASVLALIVSLLVGLSVFMYVAFYYVYVPAISHERPVHLQFESCRNGKGICNFPSAHVSLTKRQQLLMFGQPYRVQLELVMPESPANKHLGMFMVCIDFRTRDGTLVTQSCRSTMLHYKSQLLHILNMVFFWPFFLFGTAEEKQQVSVEFFSEFQEDENLPVTDVYIEVQSMYIELYSANFLIHAHFSGVRYIMFHWPILSAAVGIISNLFVVAILSLASWYQLINSEEYENFKATKIIPRKYFVEMIDDSSSIEDSSLLEELEPGTKPRKRKSAKVETLS